MGYIPPPPCPNRVPLFAHLIMNGFNPYGDTRCKNCGATDNKLRCSYCNTDKTHICNPKQLLDTPTQGKEYTI